MKNSVQVIFDTKPKRETIPSIQEVVHSLGIKNNLLAITSGELKGKWMVSYDFELTYAVSYLLQSALKYYTIAYMNELNYTALCRGFVEGD